MLIHNEKNTILISVQVAVKNRFSHQSGYQLNWPNLIDLDAKLLIRNH